MYHVPRVGAEQKRISDAAIVAVAEAAHESARALAGAYVALTVLSERTGEPAKRSRRAARRLLASPATRGFREHVDRLRTASIELQMLFERRLERRLDNLLSYRKVGAVMHAMRLLNRAEATALHNCYCEPRAKNRPPLGRVAASVCGADVA